MNIINKTIKELINYIEFKKDEIIKRFKQIKDFLNILLYINETILNKFNTQFMIITIMKILIIFLIIKVMENVLIETNI